MTAYPSAPVDHDQLTIDDAIAEAETHAKLSLVADPKAPVGRETVAAFLAACEADAKANGGRVSVSRVSAALPEDITSTERYSSLWSAFTGRGKPMRRVYSLDADGNRVPVIDERKGSKSGNNGRMGPAREWVIPSDAAKAVGRFEQDGPAGYQSSPDGPIRATRPEAEADWLAERECRCEPCPGRGNDGHGHTHCAECCFGSGVVADIDCPTHGEGAVTC